MKILSLPSDHCDLGDTNGNMAAIYERQDNLFKALSFYEKALAIFSKSLSPICIAKMSVQKNAFNV